MNKKVTCCEKEKSVSVIIGEMHSTTNIILMHTIINSKEPININRIVELTKFERTNISKRLKALYLAGLLKYELQGREKFYFFNKDISEKNIKMIDAILSAYQQCYCSVDKLPLRK